MSLPVPVPPFGSLLGQEFGSGQSVATMGIVEVLPGSANVIPGQCCFTVRIIRNPLLRPQQLAPPSVEDVGTACFS